MSDHDRSPALGDKSKDCLDADILDECSISILWMMVFVKLGCITV
jgi:hypothetical protein